MRVIRIDDAVAEGVLYLVPEPKSPHGVDVTPDGKYIVVGGKLDPHATVYSFEKIKDAIDGEEVRGQGRVRRPDPRLRRRACAARWSSASGPLHTAVRRQGQRLHRPVPRERGRRGSSVASVDGRLEAGREDSRSTTTSATSRAAEGDTVSPRRQVPDRDEQVVDRPLPPVGPLLPQNFQLIDITGDEDAAALRHADRHRRAALRADDQGRQAQAVEVYPQVGCEPDTPGDVDPSAPQAGQGAHRARRQQGRGLHDRDPQPLHARTRRGQGGRRGHLAHHQPRAGAGRDARLRASPRTTSTSASSPASTTNVTFIADKPGVFPFYCTEFCSALHLEMAGYFLVKPKAASGSCAGVPGIAGALIGRAAHAMVANTTQPRRPRSPAGELTASAGSRSRLEHGWPGSSAQAGAAILLIVSIFYRLLGDHASTRRSIRAASSSRPSSTRWSRPGTSSRSMGLNHYIGMIKLTDAATIEQAISVYAIPAMALLAIASFLVTGIWRTLLRLPVIIYPVIFVVDLFAWLYYAGHSLDPHAPMSSSIKRVHAADLRQGHDRPVPDRSELQRPASTWQSAAAVITLVVAIWERWCRPCDSATVNSPSTSVELRAAACLAVGDGGPRWLGPAVAVQPAVTAARDRRLPDL